MMRNTTGRQADTEVPSSPDLCQQFGIECRIVGDVYETDQDGNPIAEEDLKKWMVTAPADSFPTSLVQAIPLAESKADSLDLATRYLMLRDRDHFTSKPSRRPCDAEAEFPTIPTPVYLAFIMDKTFWPWNEDQKVHAADVVIKVDDVPFEQPELEPATFEDTREVYIVEGDVFQDFTRLHSLREHFASWITGHRPRICDEASA